MPKGLAQDPVSVTLPRWAWWYFLGWLEAKRDAEETSQTLDILMQITGALDA